MCLKYDNRPLTLLPLVDMPQLSPTIEMMATTFDNYLFLPLSNCIIITIKIN